MGSLANGHVVSVDIVSIMGIVTHRSASTQGQNHWQWAKIVDAGTDGRDGDGKVCFAYMRDRIAVAFPKLGVKVWLWIKGNEECLAFPW